MAYEPYYTYMSYFFYYVMLFMNKKAWPAAKGSVQKVNIRSRA